MNPIEFFMLQWNEKNNLKSDDICAQPRIAHVCMYPEVSQEKDIEIIHQFEEKHLHTSTWRLNAR